MNKKTHSIPIDETDLYVLFKEFDEVSLFEKDTNKELWRIHFYGEATCGFISLAGNDWIIIGGEKLILWNNGIFETISDENLKWIHEIRQISEIEVEILTDPWSENSAIWTFNVNDKTTTKIKEFNEYKLKEYTENVVW